VTRLIEPGCLKNLLSPDLPHWSQHSHGSHGFLRPTVDADRRLFVQGL
jgi:hypothetical protein